MNQSSIIRISKPFGFVLAIVLNLLFQSLSAQEIESTQSESQFAIQPLAAPTDPGDGGVVYPPDPPSTTFTVTNNCGFSTIKRNSSSSSTEILWLWQDSEEGENTDPELTRDTYNVTKAGTYYLRAMDRYTLEFSAPISVNVSSVTTEPNAPNTTISSTVNCGETILRRESNPTGSVLWYWQETAQGEEKINSTDTYKGTGSVAFLRSYNESTQCWSDALTYNYEFKRLPNKPLDPVEVTSDCGEATVAFDQILADKNEWHWQTSRDGENIDPIKDDVSRTFFESGSVFARTFNSNTGCWSEALEIAVAVMQRPSMPSEISNTPTCGPGEAVLSVALPDDADEIVWYDAQVNGNEVGRGLNLSIEIDSDQDFYAASLSHSSNCESSSRLKMTGRVKSVPVSTFQVANETNECAGQGASLVLSGSEEGVTYELLRNEVAYGRTMPGTGSEINFSAVYQPGTYTVRASNNESSCESLMGGYMIVNPEVPMPPQMEVSDNVCGDKLVSIPDGVSIPHPSEVGFRINWKWMGKDPDNADYEPYLGEKSVSETGTYYIKAVGFMDDGSECWSEALAINIDVIPGPEPIAPNRDYINVSGNVCGVKDAEIIQDLSEAQVEQEWFWQGKDSQSKSMDHPGSTLTGISESGNYFVRSRTIYGCWSDAVAVAVYPSVYPEEKSIQTSSSLADDPANFRKVFIEDSELYTEYRLLKDGEETGISFNGSGAYTASPVLTENGNYQVVANLHGCELTFSESVTIEKSVSNNWSQSKGITVPVNSIEAIDGLGNDLREMQSYGDAYGRSKQTIVKNASPAGANLVGFNEYDQFGRQLKSYLPYASDGSGDYIDNPSEEQKSYYQSNDDGVTKDSRPFSEIQYDGSPYNRIQSVIGEGEIWFENDKQRTANYLMATSEDQVMRWEMHAGYPLFMGYYESGELSKLVRKDEENKETHTFTNKLGQTVLSRVKADEGWADTYRIFDDYGRLRVVLPPMAKVEMDENESYILSKDQIFDEDADYGQVTETPDEVVVFVPPAKINITAGTNMKPGARVTSIEDYAIDTDILDVWAFLYRYDDRGRLVEKKTPGLGWEYLVYDDLDRLVLTQDARLRNNNQWNFVKYDQVNRSILSGHYIDAIHLTRTEMQAFLDAELAAGNYAFYEVRENTVHGYSNQSFPNVANVDSYLSVTYYDNYDFSDVANHSQWSFDDFSEEAAAKTLVTGGKTRVLDSEGGLVPGGWNESVVLYDSRLRVSEVHSRDYMGNTNILQSEYRNIVHSLLVKSVSTHFFKELDLTTTITQSYSYDHRDRLMSISHQVNDQEAVIILSNEYNELGQLQSKKLHEDEDDYAQQIDYRYNIRGWLTKINDPVANNQEDYFAMELLYTEATNAQFNGNIGAMKWKNPYEEDVQTYDYTYDQMNRLVSAEYSTTNQTTARDYDVTGLTYDLNGNILSLNRKGDLENGSSADLPGQDIDQLIYHYSGNFLTKVDDLSESVRGFKDGVDLEQEYFYDDNGNLLIDKNKGIDTIYYNHMNLPTRVVLNDTTYTDYVYDASGNKWATVIYQNEVEVKRTLYLGSLIFESKDGETPQLSLIHHAEGRILPTEQSEENEEKFEYQYYLTDHLGNVRTTFTTQPKTGQAVASMEEERVENERNYFAEYDQVMRIKADLFNHTEGGSYSFRLNGTDAERNGPVRQLKVKPGDVIDMEVFAKYLDQSQSGGWEAGLNTLLAQIAGAASGIAIEGANYGSGNLPFADLLSGSKEGEDGVQAYLNYLVFDQNFKFLGEQSGFQQLSEEAAEDGNHVDHERLSHSIEIKEAGYIFIYVSNDHEVPVDVFFDDFKVVQHHSAIVQMDNYYPYGMSFNAYDQLGVTEQKYGFNSGSEYEDMLAWYDTPFRKYDPALGRFHGADAMAGVNQSLGLSQFANNNPMSFNDPTGLNANPFINWGQGSGSGGAGGRNSILPGSGNHWTDEFKNTGGAGGKSTMEIASHLMKQPYGGTWTPEQGFVNFSDEIEALHAGYSYNEKHNSWSNTIVGASNKLLQNRFDKSFAELRNGELYVPYTDVLYWDYLFASKNQSEGKNNDGYTVEYNEGVNFGLTNMGFANDAVNAAGEITSLHVSKGLQKVTTRQAAGLSKLTKGTGYLGAALAVGVASYEYSTGKFDSHSIVDLTVAGGSVILGGVAVIIGSPALLTGVAVGGLVYGVASAAGSDWFDEYTNHWGRDLVY